LSKSKPSYSPYSKKRVVAFRTPNVEETGANAAALATRAAITTDLNYGEEEEWKSVVLQIEWE
jgi:hypothetical protein